MIANHSIGLARENDAANIALLSRDAIEQGLSWSWTPQRVLKSLRDVATNTIVAREASMLSGFAIMKYRDDDAHLLLMAVHASRHRRGVGSALLEWLEATARVAGLTSVRVEARELNFAARALYYKQGYKQVELLRGYYQGVDDAVVMKKMLRD